MQAPVQIGSRLTLYQFYIAPSMPFQREVFAYLDALTEPVN
ncbi:MAG: hypothetical protein ACTHKF_02000 [Candidatus Nitrosocosmicus sp.]